MSQSPCPCSIDVLLETLGESERAALRPYVEMLGLRYAFVSRMPSDGGLEATLLSPRHLVPARQLPGGRWDLRVLPLSLVLAVALREEADSLEAQLELFQAAPLVLRWPGATLATVAHDKAFRLLMDTCGFATAAPQRGSRPGFRGLS